MMNVGNPDIAFGLAALPNDGVGLARMEFIIANSIKAHPMALVHPGAARDARERAEIARLTANYASPSEFFVQRLSEGVGTIAAAFYPKPVVVRMSDFKTNEYASLLGGEVFETQEANPMIGFRGASRYAHPAYREGFALECAAMKRVRDEMGLTNVKLMIPFCRRIEEAEKVISLMRELGLERGKDGLEIYVMCEIPNNVMLIDQFSKHFDGFSIGSNDLTQLTLGVDRDSEIVAFDFDERDEGVKEIIRLAVEGAQAQRAPLRHLRPGALGLSGDRRVSRAPGNRFDQPQSRHGFADHKTHRRPGEASRSRAEKDGLIGLAHLSHSFKSPSTLGARARRRSIVARVAE